MTPTGDTSRYEPDDLGRYSLYDRNGKQTLTLGPAAVKELKRLGVSDSEKVVAEAHEDGVLLRPADGAPMTDGGYHEPPQNTGQVHDPGPAPEDACIECGTYGAHRCGCCGFPLCGRHHEVGGGFCTRFTPIADVPLCAYSTDVYVRALPRPDGEEPWVLDDGHGVAFHLPSPGDPETPFCGGLPASRVTSRPLGDSLIDDHDLCEDCAQAARYERRARKRRVARDLRPTGGDRA